MSNKEELSLVLRYMFNDEIKFTWRESLVRCWVVEWLSNHDLSLSNMRGQCYDGASNMSGARSGCKAIVQQAAPLAQYFHCASHRLNLAVVSASKITALRNAVVHR